MESITRRSWLQFAGSLLSLVCGVKFDECVPQKKRRKLLVRSGQYVRICRCEVINDDGQRKDNEQLAFIMRQSDWANDLRGVWIIDECIGAIDKDTDIDVYGTLELGSFVSVGKVHVHRNATLYSDRMANAFLCSLTIDESAHVQGQ